MQQQTCTFTVPSTARTSVLSSSKVLCTDILYGVCKTPVRQPSVVPGQQRCMHTFALSTAGRERRRCVLLDYTSRPVPYEEGRELQRQCVERVLSFGGLGGLGHDYLIMLQHEAVFTMGAGSSLDNLKFEINKPPLPVHWVERGGEVTYHGPGQLVLYPVLDLRAHTPDLHWYLRTLEQVAIRALWEVSGLEAARVDGLTGVWLGPNKVAAIGVRARRWVTYHGMALNVHMDLRPFNHIVPCGIAEAGRGVTMVSEELERRYGSAGRPPLPQLWPEYCCALQEAFEHELGVQLVISDETTRPSVAHPAPH